MTLFENDKMLSKKTSMFKKHPKSFISLLPGKYEEIDMNRYMQNIIFFFSSISDTPFIDKI